jgi:hypothetical protein
MAFKLRSNFTKFGLSNKFTSPLKKDPTDPAKEKDFTVTSDVTTGEDGNTVQVMERERVDIIDPTRNVENIETDNEKFLAGFSNEYKKAQESGFKGTLPEYIKKKEQGLGFTGSEEKVTEQRTITESTEQGEEVEITERPKTFYEDFNNAFNIKSERGEDGRISNFGWNNQQLTGKKGNSYNKVNFNDKETSTWLRSEEGKALKSGGYNMLTDMEDKVAGFLIEANPWIESSKTMLRTEVNKRMNSMLGLGNSSSDARDFGIDSPIEAWMNIYANNPEKLKDILKGLGLTGEGGMTEEKTITPTSKSSSTDTGWQES